MTTSAAVRRPSIGRGRGREACRGGLLPGLALVHGALLALAPPAPFIALGLWWNSNTVSHYFIHRPFFQKRTLNALFSLYLTLILGIPQTLWRQRHLAHHAGRSWKLRITPLLAAEAFLVLALWGTLLALAPPFFLASYLPGYAIGLGLCAVHGYYEHARGATSHYGALYNLLFLNDGYHIEHHAAPGLHWTRLPERVEPGGRTSRWPAVLRWLESFSLEGLERLAMGSRTLGSFVIDRHQRAIRRLLGDAAPARVGIIGGGLFPRTAIVLRRLLPKARLVIIDASAENIRRAREFLGSAPGSTGQLGSLEFIEAFYEPLRPAGGDFELLVVPLSYRGDREAIYRSPPAPRVLVHDWIWRRRGAGAVVSPLLLKRINRVDSCPSV